MEEMRQFKTTAILPTTIHTVLCRWISVILISRIWYFGLSVVMNCTCTAWCYEGTSSSSSPSWEAGNYTATQEPPSILWNPKFHYCVHKSLPLVPILSQIDPVHTIPSYLPKLYFNTVHPPMSWAS
jgi:hypothetical protein